MVLEEGAVKGDKVGGKGCKCKGYRVRSSCVLRCSSIIVRESAIIQNCTGIGRMEVTCKVGIIDYSVSGEW
jgi:hypothetical protein